MTLSRPNAQPTSQYLIDLIALTRRMSIFVQRHQCGHYKWYAELLVASALQGKLFPRINEPDCDVVTEGYGKVQVKCRLDGTDGKQNRTNFGRYCPASFDHAVVMLFTSDFQIERAILIPSGAILSLVRPHGHVKFGDVCAATAGRDITQLLNSFTATSDDDAA